MLSVQALYLASTVFISVVVHDDDVPELASGTETCIFLVELCYAWQSTIFTGNVGDYGSQLPVSLCVFLTNGRWRSLLMTCEHRT